MYVFGKAQLLVQDIRGWQDGPIQRIGVHPLQTQIRERHTMSVVGMTKTILTTALVNAITQDEHSKELGKNAGPV
jgi:hypothetical protein